MATTSSNSTAVGGIIAFAVVTAAVKIITSHSSPSLQPAAPQSYPDASSNASSNTDFTRDINWNAIRGGQPSAPTSSQPQPDFVDGVNWDRIRGSSPTASNQTSTPQSNLSHEQYVREIQNELGSEYVVQFEQLTRGDFRYTDRVACYMVYAYQHGWKNAYWVGRKNLDAGTGSQIAYSQIGTWEGVTPAELKNLKSMVAAGWRAGYERGASDLVSGNLITELPQPQQSEFRKYFQPAGLIGPPSNPDEDLWGDLRNAD